MSIILGNMPVEDGDVELRRGVIEVLCWAALRYYGTVHAAQIAGILREMGLDIQRSTVSACLRRLERFGWIERAEARGKKVHRYRLTRIGAVYLETRFLHLQQLAGIAGWLMNRSWPYPFREDVHQVYIFATEKPKKKNR